MGVLKTIFGLASGEDHPWRVFCARAGGTFVDTRIWSGVAVRERSWTVLLDIGHAHVLQGYGRGQPYTRFRVPYRTHDGFRFALYRRTPLIGLRERGHLHSMPRMAGSKVGLEDDFTVRTTDIHKAKSLFTHPAIRQLALISDEIFVHVNTDGSWLGVPWPAGVVELEARTRALFMDADHLMAMHALCVELINQLHVLGSASEAGVELGI